MTIKGQIDLLIRQKIKKVLHSLQSKSGIDHQEFEVALIWLKLINFRQSVIDPKIINRNISDSSNMDPLVSKFLPMNFLVTRYKQNTDPRSSTVRIKVSLSTKI